MRLVDTKSRQRENLVRFIHPASQPCSPAQAGNGQPHQLDRDRPALRFHRTVHVRFIRVEGDRTLDPETIVERRMVLPSVAPDASNVDTTRVWRDMEDGMTCSETRKTIMDVQPWNETMGRVASWFAGCTGRARADQPRRCIAFANPNVKVMHALHGPLLYSIVDAIRSPSTPVVVRRSTLSSIRPSDKSVGFPSVHRKKTIHGPTVFSIHPRSSDPVRSFPSCLRTS